MNVKKQKQRRLPRKKNVNEIKQSGKEKEREMERGKGKLRNTSPQHQVHLRMKKVIDHQQAVSFMKVRRHAAAKLMCISEGKRSAWQLDVTPITATGGTTGPVLILTYQG